MQVYLEKLGDWFLSSGIKIFFILFIALIVIKIAGILSDKIIASVKKQRRKDTVEFQKRADTLKSVIRYVFNIAVFVIAVGMIL
jgi:small-conductance mechanosensitive channel